MRYNHVKSLRFFVIILSLSLAWATGCDDDGGNTGSFCGDGVVDTGEECDPAATDGPTCEDLGYRKGFLTCTQQCVYDFSGCIPKVCGDGIVDKDLGEECDEGANNSDAPDAACRTDCTLPRCGDGVVDEGEECDDGTANSDEPNACRTDCTLPFCGDGITDSQLGEECDDGNNVSGDGCSADCKSTEICGNGYMDGGEECDDGTANSDEPNACRPDCTNPRCGDGIIDDHFGEECDEGANNSDAPDAQCRTDCTPKRCGDGIVDTGEECDDGAANSDDPNACRPDCTNPRCGDGIVDTYEECDDGTANSDAPDASCRTDCTPRRCGDGIVDSGEVCDDGNDVSGDGCSADCLSTETCGNGIVDVDEECDDGTANSDAPDASCRTDCTPRRCGDGIVDSGEECDDANSTDWDGCTGCAITEFRVNTHTADNQSDQELAMAADGHFVVVWTSEDQDGNGFGIYGQLFNADGTRDGSEFRINSYTYAWQEQPGVAMAPDGRFVVVWESSKQDDDLSSGIYGQLFDADGSRHGSEFRINSHIRYSQDHPSVAMDSDGRFVVVWQSMNQDGDGFGVYGQRYDASGTPDGTEFQVNSTTPSLQMYPRVAMDSDGRFVVVWQSMNQDGDGFGVYGQRYDASGTPDGTEFRVNSHTSGDQEYPDVAMGSDGHFVVVWQSANQDGSGYGIYAQIYGSDGSALGGEFQVNGYTTDDQSAPSVAVAPDGHFVVVWSNYGPDESGIHGQRYNATGGAVGSEFSIKTYTSGWWESARIAMNDDGTFVTAWDASVQNGSDWDIFAQRFTSDGSPLGVGSMP